MDEQRPLGDPPFLGSTLSERYLLRSLLGRGGMGEVYECEDLRLHRLVAVKLLRPELAGDPVVVSRFRREARTAGSLQHANVVAVHDVGVDGGRAYLVMELVRGRTLAEVIRAEAPLTPGRAARIGERIADALAFAHARGIVHRDVSPGNVMLTDSGQVKVLDFGIAQTDRHGSTAPRSVHGTAAYVAPEVTRGLPADRRSDIYSLGAVLHELLTGEPPQPARSWAERQLPPGVPSTLAAVVTRSLAYEPDERHADAAEVARALAGVLGETAQTRPIPLLPPRPDPAARRAASTPVLETAATLPIPPRDRSGGRRRARRWAVASATVIAGLATWFVALPVWHAMSEPTVPAPPRAPAALQAPTAVTATGTCDGFWSARVELTWEPARTPASAFEIYRADEEAGPYRLLDRVDGAATAWTDRGLGLDATYRYLLRAVDDERRSPLTPELAGSTPLLCLG